MNAVTKIAILALSLLFNYVTAQEFHGVATYKSKRNIEVKLDSTQIDSEMHQKMMAIMKKRFEKTHILTFNKESSLYKEEEVLAPPAPAGVEMVIVNTGGSDILFKDIKQKRYTNQIDVFGKIFLIKDNMEELDWQLSADTKNIGEYTCFKATSTKEVEVRGESGISINGDKELDDDKVTKKTVSITAWYTTQIPISNGPSMYQGLPGLVLEASDGSEAILCSKIVLNPDEPILIEEPSRGKEVNKEEFELIMKEKLNEMNDRYSSDRKDGNSIEIKIRG